MNKPSSTRGNRLEPPAARYRVQVLERTIGVLQAVADSETDLPAADIARQRFPMRQLMQPLDLPKGTKVKTVAHYDNSRANKFNPDATRSLRYGAQSWDEMHVTFVGILIDAKANPARTFGSGRAPAPAAE